VKFRIGANRQPTDSLQTDNLITNELMVCNSQLGYMLEINSVYVVSLEKHERDIYEPRNHWFSIYKVNGNEKHIFLSRLRFKKTYSQKEFEKHYNIKLNIRANIHSNRGLFWYEKENYDKAISSFNEAVRQELSLYYFQLSTYQHHFQ